MKHYPVLLKEAVEGLKIRPDGVYADGTFGAGGHSREILKQLTTGELYGLDRDRKVLEEAFQDERLRLRHNNFSDMADVLRADGIRQIDGVLLDLGVSSMQFDEEERGFSYRFSSDLDMRMNREMEMTAVQVIQRYAEAELQEIFSSYGEIRNSKSLAKAVVAERKKGNLLTTGDLEQLAVGRSIGNPMRYLSQVFQAIRMEVNDEIGELKRFLERSEELVRPGGRLVIISFHSLEDRLVKNYMKAGTFDGKPREDMYGPTNRPYRVLTKKPVTADENELKENVRSRSAKLRIAERNDE